MYFFEQDEVRALLGAEPRGGTTGQPMFDVTQIGEDRRMVRVMIPDWRRVLMPDCEPEGEAADVPDMAAGQSDQEVVDGSGEEERRCRDCIALLSQRCHAVWQWHIIHCVHLVSSSSES